MDKTQLFQFMAKHDLAVLASVSPSGSPQAALMGIAVTPELEIVFDTLTTSRKYQNLVLNPQIAFVIGWENETTVQYEGKAEELHAPELQLYKEVYFRKWPDGREREKWPSICYFRVRPTWIRYSDFNKPTYEIVEIPAR
jgi:pyridoxine/pyridoxamine 5'-phosphate oxidase